MKFPDHKGSLSLTHNRHRDYYMTIEEDLERDLDDRKLVWVSEEERAKAIATDEVWVLHWYPYTPVGSITLAASSLDVLLAEASEETR